MSSLLEQAIIDAKILKAVIKDLDGSARELNKAKVKLEKEKEKRDRKAVKK